MGPYWSDRAGMFFIAIRSRSGTREIGIRVALGAGGPGGPGAGGAPGGDRDLDRPRAWDWAVRRADAAAQIRACRSDRHRPVHVFGGLARIGGVGVPGSDAIAVDPTIALRYE